MFKLINRTATFLTVKPAKEKAFILNAGHESKALSDDEMSPDIATLLNRRDVMLVPVTDVKKVVPPETAKAKEKEKDGGNS